MADLPRIAPRDWSSQPPYLHPAYASTPLRAPKRPLVPLAHTLAELAQPVYGHEDIDALDHDLTRNAAVNGAPLGERIVVTGRVLDERGRPVRRTLVELWQCNAAYPWGNHPNAWRPNHIHFSLFGEHFASRLVTQMYFPGDPLLEHDPIYQSTRPGVRERLVSRFDLAVTEPGFALGYTFDIVLRGPMETPTEARR